MSDVTIEQRQRIAAEQGVPIGLADRLRGDTVADLTADAKLMAQGMKTRAKPASLQEAIQAGLQKNADAAREKRANAS